MNETQPPATRTPKPEIPEALASENLSLGKQKSRQDRIFGYSTLASVVVTFGWLAWVSNSDLFGSAATLADLKPQLIKIVKPPIPQKPKPKKKEPPPPPPKQKPPPKLKPLKPPPPHPRPQTPRPAPLHRVQVATTHNTHAVSNVTVPDSAPNTDTKPTASGTSANVTPPAPQQIPTPTPAPPPVQEVVKPAPPPPPPPVKEVVKPPPPPPPPPRPRNYSSIDSQEAGPIGDYAQPDIPSDVDQSTITNRSVTVSYQIEEDGHVTGVRIRKSSGNADVDEALKNAIKRTRFKPAIQDHLKLRQAGEYTFTVG